MLALAALNVVGVGQRCYAAISAWLRTSAHNTVSTIPGHHIRTRPARARGMLSALTAVEKRTMIRADVIARIAWSYGSAVGSLCVCDAGSAPSQRQHVSTIPDQLSLARRKRPHAT
jgi:hypothetical protein